VEVAEEEGAAYLRYAKVARGRGRRQGGKPAFSVRKEPPPGHYARRPRARGRAQTNE